MSGQSIGGLLALAALVVGIVIYRAVWFTARQRRRTSSVEAFRREK